MKVGEFELIEILKKRIPRRLQGEVGIGDDAGVYCGKAGKDWLLTTDTLVENVDFIMGKAPAELIGRKALAINLSDIAAMGGEPVACVIALGIPKKLNHRWIEKFYKGLIRLAGEYRVLCIGGDISRSRDFFASIALVGRAVRRGMIQRNGARPGDWIGVTGCLGGSILGHHLTFQPRLKEASFLSKNYKPSAMIDISDGLVQDLEHLLKASRVMACVDLLKIPVSGAARKLSRWNLSRARERALSDGEDFELLFTLSDPKKRALQKIWAKKFPRVPLSWVGRIIRGKPGIKWRAGNQTLRRDPFPKKGFSHF